MLAEEVRAAAALGHSQDLVRLLARPDSNKFVPDSDGRTALHLAAASGHSDVTASLVFAGAPVNALDSAGCTALQVAASEGHELIVEHLLKHGGNPNYQDNVHGNTALHEASWKGFSRTVAVLCKNKANMHIKNFGGFAALHLCCQNGHNQSCRELLIAGCSPDLQNNYGDTPLHTSARYGHAGVTRILISAHCRVSDQNKNGDTALHIAAAMGRRKMTRILIEAGCNKSLRNKQQETAKEIATRKDLNEILSILNSTKKSSQKKKEDKDKPDGVKVNNTSHKEKKKHKPEHKVHFEKLPSKNWSPYGCHYYPDAKNFPAPNLDSLPNEPLHKGEQYFLDLAGNIRKGPVGVGYTCYCAPFFQHMEAKLEKDKEELKKQISSAEKRIDKKVQHLERQTEVRISQLRRQHQHLTQWLRGESYLPRAKSLDLLDEKSLVNVDLGGASELCQERRVNQGDHRSMEDLCSERESDHEKDFSKKPRDFWRTQFANERLQKYLSFGQNKAKCPDLVSSVNQNAEKCSASPHIEECVAGNETDVKDLESVINCDKNVSASVLPSWKRQELHNSVHEIVSRVSALQWRRSGDGREEVETHKGEVYRHDASSESSDGEECERANPWSEVKKLPYRSRSAVYSPPLDRDNNDSGYSTKICSNSQGPSPSLSGRLQGDEVHSAEFFMERQGVPAERHLAVPFRPDSTTPDPRYQGPSPLGLHYTGPSYHHHMSAELAQARLSVKECQNLHTEASLV